MRNRREIVPILRLTHILRVDYAKSLYAKLTRNRSNTPTYAYSTRILRKNTICEINAKYIQCVMKSEFCSNTPSYANFSRWFRILRANSTRNRRGEYARSNTPIYANLRNLYVRVYNNVLSCFLGVFCTLSSLVKKAKNFRIIRGRNV